MPQQFKAARPAHRFKTGTDGIFRDVPAMGAHHPQSRDSQRRISGLVAADQGQVHIRQAVKVELHCVKAAALVFQPAEIHLSQLGMLFSTDAADNNICLRHAAVAHHRALFLDDPRLGGGNVRKSGAKLLHMIHTQCRDDCALRGINDVGGIQRAAKAHLQHHDLTFLLGKIEHPKRRDDLKLGGHIFHGIGGGLYLLHQFHQLFVRDLHAVDLDALVEAVDEGRGVQAHPIARGLQAGCHHGGGAALAVGACNMHESELFVRVAQCGQQGAGARQAWLVAGPLDRMDVFHCLFVIHCNASFYFFTIFIRVRFSSRMRSSTVFTAARISALGMRTASVAHG